MNWDTVFEIVLGAVLGFMSSVCLGMLTKAISGHRLLGKMTQELDSIYDVISKNIDSAERFELISPIWDYIIESDILFSFDANKYAKIIKLYGEIQAFKDSEKSLTISRSDLEENRKNLLSVIENNRL